MNWNSNRWLAILILLMALATPAFAGTMKVAWDPVPGASGYNLYYGTAANNYSTTVNVGNTTQATLTGIGDCEDYYVAAKAYNSIGEAEQFSNEVSGWAQPVVSTGGTISVKQGDQFTLDVTGVNFEPGAQLLIDTASIPTDQNGTPLVRVENPAILDCDHAQALITVDPLGPGGRAMEIGNFNFDIQVLNPDGIYGANVSNLAVGFQSFRSDLNRTDAMTRDRVDGKDLAWLAYSHGSSEGETRWNADADLSGDGVVDGQDLALLAIDFGRCWNGSNWSASACP